MKVRRKHYFWHSCVFSALILVCSSCAPGEHPFLMVQLCLEDDEGVGRFKQQLQSIADDEGMRFVDGSARTARDLKVLKVAGENMHLEGGLIHVGVHGDSGPGLTAGNMSLNKYDVAIGFSRGGDDNAASAFSKIVLERLKQDWDLKVVSDGTGAFPDPTCVQRTEAPPNNSFKPTPLRGAA